MSVRREHPLRAGLAHGAQEAGPVRMVRDHEAAIESAPAARPADAEDPGGERLLEAAEALHPGRAAGGDRGQHQLARKTAIVAHEARPRQRDALLAIDLGERLHHAVHAHFAIREPRDLRKQPLRLAERIAEQHRGLARVALPPGDDPCRHRARIVPAEERQGVGGLGDEDVAPHQLERRAGRVRLALVVSREDPDARAAFDAHLSRPEHVAGRVQRNGRVADTAALAVGKRLDPRALQAPAQELGGLGCAEIGRRTGARVIAVRMREHGAFHRLNGVEVERAVRAEETLRGIDDHAGAESTPMERPRRSRPAHSAAEPPKPSAPPPCPPSPRPGPRAPPS